MNCYILNKDLLTWTRNTVAWVAAHDMTPIIVDNNSTYPPLLEWYAQKPCDVKHNTGNSQWEFWGMGVLPSGYFYVTDNDLDYTGIPDDFHDVLMRCMLAQPRIHRKVGFSIEINDIPEPNASRVWAQGQTIKQWEQKFWDSEFVQPAIFGQYDASIDTTFALYKNRTWVTDAIRLRRPYTVRHLPWYLDYAHLDDEYSYYVDHAGGGSTVAKRIKEFRAQKLAKLESIEYNVYGCQEPREEQI